MKKRLEADLISIAHRILKLKNRSELIQLHRETHELYEKLSVLRFVEENFGDVKPTIGLSEIREKLEAAFTTEAGMVTTDEPNIKEEDIKDEAVTATKEGPKEEGIKEETGAAAVEELPETVNEEHTQAEASPKEEQIPEVVAEIATIPVQEDYTIEENHIPTEEDIQEEEHIQEEEEHAPEVYDYEYVEKAVATIPEQPVAEQQEPITTEEPAPQKEVFTPAFELSYEPPTEEAPQEVKKTPQQISFEELLGYSYKEPIFEKIGEKINEIGVPENEAIPVPDIIIDATKSVSLNDTLSKTIAIGLNDRIGFEKHLFSGSSEDLNRVLSQLNTFNNLKEATHFITNFVKPDYNNWQGKEEYESRFMELVEKKFA